MQDHDFLSSLPQGCNELSRLLALCEQHLTGIVSVQGYEYTSCYLWHDRPLYDSFGDTIKVLSGDTIYLNEKSLSLNGDLFHELGHVVARKFNLVGHSENSYQGTWENNNAKLIAQVAKQRHWSQYLNLFSLNHDDFKANAASELWAELFMLGTCTLTRVRLNSSGPPCARSTTNNAVLTPVVRSGSSQQHYD